MNHLAKQSMESAEDRAVIQEAVRGVILMLTPIVPHFAHEVWRSIGDGNDIEDTLWPSIDESALVEDEKLIIVQVNGKLRAKLTVSANAQQDEVQALAMAEENVSKFTDDKTIRKVIFVHGKLLNIVAN